VSERRVYRLAIFRPDGTQVAEKFTRLDFDNLENGQYLCAVRGLELYRDLSYIDGGIRKWPYSKPKIQEIVDQATYEPPIA